MSSIRERDSVPTALERHGPVCRSDGCFAVSLLWFFHCVPWLVSTVGDRTKNDDGNEDGPRSTNDGAYFQVTKFIDDRFVGQETDILGEIVGLVRQTTTIRFTAILRFYWVDTFENAYASRLKIVQHGR